MITKLNTYEGVPIGGNNFEDFLSYVRAFLGANFGFSTNALTNQGGYFSDDEFVFEERTAVDPFNRAYFFVPDTREFGNLFGRRGTEYYRFEVLNATPPLEPQVNVWTLLPSTTESPELDEFVFTNTSEEDKLLPYRPLRKNSSDEYLEGYLDVRFNGTPQERNVDYTVSFSTVSNFREQSLQFNRMRLGAEFPEPIVNSRYDSSMLDPEEGITRAQLEGPDFESRLTFPFTNFSTEFGGHIVLWRKVGAVNYFAYMQQDLGSEGPIPSGRYRVLDFARGIIELNISTDQLNRLRIPTDGPNPATDIPFIVVSAEQLLEDTSGGATSHLSRYGGLYNGSASDVILAEYIFDGSSTVVRHIPDSFYSSSLGSVLLEDVNQSFTDGIILAIQYYGIPNKEALESVQRNRYKPDVFKLYYNTGIVIPDGTTSTIRSVVETNPGSWYNRDVLSAEYFPVPRVDESFYSLITEDEAGNFSDVFDPSFSFQIVDTIGLGDLNDLAPMNSGEVVFFNGTSFEGRPYQLGDLLNVQSGASANDILQYNSTTQEWSRRSLTQILTQTATGGPATVSNQISYAPSVTSFTGQQLVTASYVQSLAGSVGGDVSEHIQYGISGPNANSSVHGSTSSATPFKIVQRNSDGRASVEESFFSISSSEDSTGIINQRWAKNNSATTATANRLMLRDGSGRAGVIEASQGINDADSLNIINHRWVRNNSTTSGTAWTLMSRDSAGRSSVEEPGAGVTMASVDSKLIVNQTWMKRESSVNADGNKLILRSNVGRARISNPLTFYSNGSGSNPGTFNDPSNNEIANATWVLNTAARINRVNDNAQMLNQGANAIPKRDEGGYLYARTPISGSFSTAMGRTRTAVATKEYVDNAIVGATSFSPILDSTNVQYLGGTSNTVVTNLNYSSNSALSIRDNNFHHLYDNVGIYTFTINAGTALAAFFTVRLSPRYRLTSVMAFQGTVVNNGFPGAGNSTGYLNNNAASAHVMYGGYVAGNITPNNTSRNLFIGCRKGSAEHVRYSIQIIGTFA